MRRSLLFIPANNPNMIINGGILWADCLIFDLEDAVSPAEKDAARDLLQNALETVDFMNCQRIVRINGLDTPYWQEDLTAVLPERPDAILLPKTGGAADIKTIDKALCALEDTFGVVQGETKVIALLETAQGIENAAAIAEASDRMVGLFLGAEDYAANIHCTRTLAGTEILYARSRVINAARAAGIEPYDTPFIHVDDLEGLEKDAILAKELGFSGKAAISPGHISEINKIFSPTAAEIRYAQEVFDALEEAKQAGKGAVALRGKMIDAPVVMRARQILEMAAALEGGMACE